jgi:hypothetical protein
LFLWQSFRKIRTSAEDSNGDCDVASQVSKGAKCGVHVGGRRWRPSSGEGCGRGTEGKGKITIEYGTLEDFDRVLRRLKGKVPGQCLVYGGQKRPVCPRVVRVH